MGVLWDATRILVFLMQLQLEMLDHFGNFDKKQCQMPYITANKLCRNGPIFAYSHANLKPRHNTDLGSYDYLFMLISQVTQHRSGHMSFPDFRDCSNGSAHEISCNSA